MNDDWANPWKHIDTNVQVSNNLDVITIQEEIRNSTDSGKVYTIFDNYTKMFEQGKVSRLDYEEVKDSAMNRLNAISQTQRLLNNV